MGKTQFVLHETLKDIDVSGYRIAVEAKIRPNTIYDIIENKKKTISLEYLTAIIEALNRISKEKKLGISFGIMDVIDYQK